MDNLIVKITEKQNVLKLKPVYSDRRDNLNIFTFKYTPKSYSEHVAIPLVDDKVLEIESKAFMPLASPTMCNLLIRGTYLIFFITIIL